MGAEGEAGVAMGELLAFRWQGQSAKSFSNMRYVANYIANHEANPMPLGRTACRWPKCLTGKGKHVAGEGSGECRRRVVNATTGRVRYKAGGNPAPTW